ncbi:hypothetical protein XHV734_2760 [Xanthomonas hortorum pv. vitians]|nr:hypothetical protein XHV734_2760 [Xanthomonas hortorum pv. vitians]
MVTVVMVVLMPATPAPGRRCGWQRSDAMAEALGMHAKDITRPKAVKHCVLRQPCAAARLYRKPCRTKI